MYMNDGNKTKINLINKSVFITGVAGFIGSNLAKRLLSTVEGVKVVGLDNMNHYYDVRLKEARLNELEQFENFSFVKGNLADKSVIEAIFEQYKPEIVVNLGAQAGVRYSITNPDAYVEANLIGFYLIESEILMEERKAEYFAALMLLGNLMPYFEGLKDMEFQAKAFQCMNAFQAPYKAVLISLYESAVKNGNTAIVEEVKENFDVQVEDIAQRFRDLGLDDSLVRPSYVVNVSPLQEKINKTIRNEPEVKYHKDNEAFLKTVLSE